jgi:hypothetical protein
LHFRPAWAKSKTLSQKQPDKKGAGGVAQVVEHHLSSAKLSVQIPIPPKKSQLFVTIKVDKF